MRLAELITGTWNRGHPLDPDKLRKARPQRNPLVEATREGDVLVLEAPFELGKRRAVGILAKWAKAPTTRKFELESVGAFVWDLCDGKRTFENISKELRNRYKMNRLEADASLNAFLRTLSQRGLITLLVARDK